MRGTIDQPSWPAILQGLRDQTAAGIHTALPGIVRSYDATTQVAEVQLAVQLAGVSVPPLADVPVAWPGGAAGFLHVPLSAGDTVLVVFAEEDFSKWYDTGSVSPPAILARHGLHAVAIPGLRRAATPLAVTAGTHVTLGATSEIRLGSDDATDFVALASLVLAQLNALKSAISSAVIAPNDGGASFKSTLLAALSAWPANVAAAKVKAV